MVKKKLILLILSIISVIGLSLILLFIFLGNSEDVVETTDNILIEDTIISDGIEVDPDEAEKAIADYEDDLEKEKEKEIVDKDIAKEIEVVTIKEDGTKKEEKVKHEDLSEGTVVGNVSSGSKIVVDKKTNTTEIVKGNVTISIPGSSNPTVSTGGTDVSKKDPAISILPDGKKPEKVVTDSNREVVELFEKVFGEKSNIITVDNYVSFSSKGNDGISYNTDGTSIVVMSSDRSLDSKAFTIMESLGLPLSESELNAAYKESLSKKTTITVKGVNVNSGIASFTVDWK